MKTFIIALFGLALLGSDAAWAKAKEVDRPKPQDKKVENVKGQSSTFFKVCQTSGTAKDDGVIVIEIRQTADVRVWYCDGVTEMDKPPKDVDKLKIRGNAGQILKYTDGTGDPCIEYTIGGQSRVFCWN